MLKQKLIGLFLLAFGTGMVIFGWYHALVEGVYWKKASFLFPFFAFLGLSIFLYPITKEECLAKYGSEQLGWRHMPVVQKTLIIVGVIAGIVNWALISGYI